MTETEYGKDTIEFSGKRGKIDVRTIGRLISKEGYSGISRTNWDESHGKYKLTPTNRENNYVRLEFFPQGEESIRGSIIFIYTSPDAQDENKDRVKRLRSKLGGGR